MNMGAYLNEKFKNAHGHLVQPMSYERVLETRPDYREEQQKLLIHLRKNIGISDFIIGDTKEDHSVRRKIRDDYKGDPLRVLDHERCKVVIHEPLSLLKVINELQNPNSKTMRESGAEIAGFNDLFSNPRTSTGYRCVNCKIALPVGDNEQHIGEIQIVASQIEEVYDKTHNYINLIRDIVERNRTHGLSADDSANIAYAQAACRYHNGLAARENGYDDLLDPRIRSKHAVTHVREEHLEGMMMQLHQALPDFDPG